MHVRTAVVSFVLLISCPDHNGCFFSSMSITVQAHLASYSHFCFIVIFLNPCAMLLYFRSFRLLHHLLLIVHNVLVPTITDFVPTITAYILSVYSWMGLVLHLLWPWTHNFDRLAWSGTMISTMIYDLILF